MDSKDFAVLSTAHAQEVSERHTHQKFYRKAPEINRRAFMQFKPSDALTLEKILVWRRDVWFMTNSAIAGRAPLDRSLLLAAASVLYLEISRQVRRAVASMARSCRLRLKSVSVLKMWDVRDARCVQHDQLVQNQSGQLSNTTLDPI